MNKLLLAAGLLTVASSAFAGAQKGQKQVGFQGSLTSRETEYSDAGFSSSSTQDRFNLSGTFGWFLSEHFVLRGGVGFGTTGSYNSYSDDETYSYTTFFGPGASWYIISGKSFTPYISADLYLVSDISETYGTGSYSETITTSMDYKLAVGFETFFNESASSFFQIASQGSMSASSETDGVESDADVSTSEFGLEVGLHIYF